MYLPQRRRCEDWGHLRASLPSNVSRKFSSPAVGWAKVIESSDKCYDRNLSTRVLFLTFVFSVSKQDGEVFSTYNNPKGV